MILTREQLSKLKSVLFWSSKYEISIQLWPSQTVVFIAKDGIDLESWGGDFDFAVGTALDYLNRINKKSPTGQQQQKVK